MLGFVIVVGSVTKRCCHCSRTVHAPSINMQSSSLRGLLVWGNIVIVVVALPSLIPVVVVVVVYLTACRVHNIIISMHAGDRGRARILMTSKDFIIGFNPQLIQK